MPRPPQKDAVGADDITRSALAEARETSIGSVLEALAQADAPGPDTEAAVTAAAQESATPLTQGELMQRGLDDLRAERYEQAEEKLKQVRTAGMSQGQRRQVVDALTQATNGAEQRREARRAFEQGEEALRNNRPVEAMEFYRLAANNRFADEGTKVKAAEQLALAQATQAGEVPAAPAPAAGASGAAAAIGDLTGRQHYDEGVRAAKAKDWPVARAHFEAAQKKGFRGSLWEDPPATWLKRITAREQTTARDASAAAQRSRDEAARQAQLDAARRAADQRELEATAKADAEAAARQAAPTPEAPAEPAPAEVVER
jgi:hypothetical protein